MAFNRMQDMLDSGGSSKKKPTNYRNMGYGMDLASALNASRTKQATPKPSAYGGAPNYATGGLTSTPGYTPPAQKAPVAQTSTQSTGGYSGGGGGYAAPQAPQAPAMSSYDQQRLDRQAQQDAERAKNEAYLKSEAERIKGLIANIGKDLTAPDAPERATRDNLTEELRAIYDELDYYHPDWDKLQSAQDDVMGIFGQQRDNISAEHDLAKQGLQTSFDRALGAHERGQDYRREDFGDARRQLGEDAFMQGRSIEAGAASRGLGDSGAKEAAQIQGRMAMGQGMNEFARQYYQMEEEAERTVSMAREDYEQTTLKLQQSLQGALTDIAGSEVMSIQQYTEKVEGLKRQMEADKQASALAKQNFLQTEFETRSALAAFKQAQYESELESEYRSVGLGQEHYKTELSTEQARQSFEAQRGAQDDSWQGHKETLAENKRQADQQYALAQQQMAQSAAQSNRSHALEVEKMNKAFEGSNQNLVNLSDSLIAGYGDGSGAINYTSGKAQLINMGASPNGPEVRAWKNFTDTIRLSKEEEANTVKKETAPSNLKQEVGGWFGVGYK